MIEVKQSAIASPTSLYIISLKLNFLLRLSNLFRIFSRRWLNNFKIWFHRLSLLGKFSSLLSYISNCLSNISISQKYLISDSYNSIGDLVMLTTSIISYYLYNHYWWQNLNLFVTSLMPIKLLIKRFEMYKWKIYYNDKILSCVFHFRLLCKEVELETLSDSHMWDSRFNVGLSIAAIKMHIKYSI